MIRPLSDIQSVDYSFVDLKIIPTMAVFPPYTVKKLMIKTIVNRLNWKRKQNQRSFQLCLRLIISSFRQ